MNKQRNFLPDFLTHDQEVWIDRITQQLYSAGWDEELIRQWWQCEVYELNGFCPLEAVCYNKGSLAQLAADKTLRLYEDKVNHYKDEEVAKILKDREKL